jgi:ribosomal protein L40E
MYCIKCGTQLPDDAIYCSKCGFAQSSDKFEMKNKTYRNKNKMLEGVTEMKAEGWRPITCQRIPLVGIGLLQILAHQAYTVIFERGDATNPAAIKWHKNMRWVENSRSNKVDELDEWLKEWEEKRC